MVMIWIVPILLCCWLLIELSSSILAHRCEWKNLAEDVDDRADNINREMISKVRVPDKAAKQPLLLCLDLLVVSFCLLLLDPQCERLLSLYRITMGKVSHRPSIYPPTHLSIHLVPAIDRDSDDRFPYSFLTFLILVVGHSDVPLPDRD